MSKMQEITCKCGCGRKKEVKVADIKRGWGKFFSKSCKAKWQEKRTGQYAAYMERKHHVQFNALYNYEDCDEDLSWDSHKDTFK